MSSGKLYHHGILGQRWGVRRFQNEDGTLTQAGKEHYARKQSYDNDSVIKKGTPITRVSMTDSENNQGRTYASFTDHDIQKYIQNGRMLTEMFGGTAFRYDFVAKEELKLPSRKTKVDLYLKMLDENPKFRKLLDSKTLKSGRAAQEKSFDKFQYELVKNSTRGKAYLKTLEENGYNALYDDADMRRNISELPLLIIERGRSLTLKSISKIS